MTGRQAAAGACPVHLAYSMNCNIWKRLKVALGAHCPVETVGPQRDFQRMEFQLFDLHMNMCALSASRHPVSLEFAVPLACVWHCKTYL